jgi:hypothetical protein
VGLWWFCVFVGVWFLQASSATMGREFFRELGFNSLASYLILSMLMSFFLHL